MILVTGGAGYIGSHVVKELVTQGYEVAVVDDLSTGHRSALPKDLPFYKVNLLDTDTLKQVFERIKPAAVLHFAAKSIVPESVKAPLNTYYPNLVGTMKLVKTMLEVKTKALVFSSTAAVYGEPQAIPINENHPLEPTNPYGESKLFIEKILASTAAVSALKYVSLRYFNAAGAAMDGLMGEDHNPETHLIPRVLAAAAGKNELTIYGNDYPTADGTPIRDYIHVCDLVSAHLLALEKLLTSEDYRAIYNLGNQRGYSVLEVINKAEEITGKKIPYSFGPRRPGDPAVLVAGSELIEQELSWTPCYSDLETIIATAWRWHQNHPGGYAD